MSKICDILGHDYVKASRDQDNKLYGRGFTHICSRGGCKEVSDYPHREKWNNTFWDSDAWDVTKIVLASLLATVLVFLIIWAAVNLGSEYSCNGYKSLGVNVQYSWRTGCMALHEKFGWVPVAEYFRVINLNIP
jgi:hypothetical protein